MITIVHGDSYGYKRIIVTCDKCSVHHTLVFTGPDNHCQQRNCTDLYRVYRNELLGAQWAVSNDTRNEKHICPHCQGAVFPVGARTACDTSRFHALQKLRDTKLCPQCNGLGNRAVVLKGKEIGRVPCSRCDGLGTN